MTPHDIDRVFGRGRLKMVTGPHVEVFREAAARGEARRYTKRFLTTADGDYAQWTEREWRVLARLIGHGAKSVPDVVQYDRGARGTKLVQTYDAGATVDQWATLLPVERDGCVHAHVFEDCAHWWALAHHCLVALDEIHSLELVHLDVKGDNICIPIGPPQFDPAAEGQRMFPVFRKLALIDFAFSLVSGETLPSALPIGWQQDYDYQSPRLLRALEAGRSGDLGPTEELDWRCDVYSLAAMLKRYLPSESHVDELGQSHGWTASRHAAAKMLILRLREAHDAKIVSRRPHVDLLIDTSAQLRDSEVVESLERGWELARDAQNVAAPVLPLTPVTRLAPPLRIVIPPRESIGTIVPAVPPVEEAEGDAGRRRITRVLVAAAAVVAAIGVIVLRFDASDWLALAAQRVVDRSRAVAASFRTPVAPDPPPVATASADPEAPIVEDAVEPPAASVTQTPTPAAPASKAPEPAPSVVTPTPRPAGPAYKAPEPAPSVVTPTPRPAGPAHKAPEPAPSVVTPSPPAVKDSFATQIEAYRSRAMPRSARASPASASTASASTAGRDVATQSAKPARKAPVQVSSRSARLSPSLPPNVARASGAPTAKRPTPTTVPAVAPAEPAPAPVADPIAQFAAAPMALERPVADIAADAQPPATPAPDPPRAFRSIPPAPAAPIVEKSRPFESPAIPAPRPVPSPSIAEAAQRAAPASAAPALALPPPAPPPTVLIDDDFAHLRRARQMLDDAVPRASAQVHARVARVLWVAAGPQHPAQERAILALSSHIASEAPSIAAVAPGEGRRLHDAARQAYHSRRHVPEAFDLALKAFGANPNDPEIAGHLAFLHLKVVPYQPERARQLALYALGLRKDPYPTFRFDDWTTFAVASALTGRNVEARHALYATVALARDTDRVCRALLGAVSSYGDRLRDPVEAMVERLHRQGRAGDTTYCSWLSDRMAGARLQ